MANIKKAIRNIPERQPDEEPVSQRQIGYLRSFGYFSEKLIKNLGVWQASYLIDQAKLIKEEDSATQNKSRKKGGCGTLIFFLLVLFLVIGIVSKCPESENDNPSNDSESKSEVANSENPVKPEGQAAPVPEQISEVVEKSLDLTVIQYPVTVVTTEKFELLNEVGKETPISEGTIINIESRSDLGTLKMTIGGELFVGNESRMIGKIELK